MDTMVVLLRNVQNCDFVSCIVVVRVLHPWASNPHSQEAGTTHIQRQGTWSKHRSERETWTLYAKCLKTGLKTSEICLWPIGTLYTPHLPHCGTGVGVRGYLKPCETCLLQPNITQQQWLLALLAYLFCVYLEHGVCLRDRQKLTTVQCVFIHTKNKPLLSNVLTIFRADIVRTT